MNTPEELFDFVRQEDEKLLWSARPFKWKIVRSNILTVLIAWILAALFIALFFWVKWWIIKIPCLLVTLMLTYGVTARLIKSIFFSERNIYLLTSKRIITQEANKEIQKKQVEEVLSIGLHKRKTSIDVFCTGKEEGDVKVKGETLKKLTMIVNLKHLYDVDAYDFERIMKKDFDIEIMGFRDE